MHRISSKRTAFTLKAFLATFADRWAGWIRPR